MTERCEGDVGVHAQCRIHERATSIMPLGNGPIVFFSHAYKLPSTCIVGCVHVQYSTVHVSMNDE